LQRDYLLPLPRKGRRGAGLESSGVVGVQVHAACRNRMIERRARFALNASGALRPAPDSANAEKDAKYAPRIQNRH
jgi:hypothetical protein